MKLITSVLILALTGTALAQAPANKNATSPAAKSSAAPVKPAAKMNPAAAKPAISAPKSQVTSAKSAAAAPKPAANTASTRTAHKNKAVAKTQPKPAESADGNKPAVPAVSSKNRRDPFLSVVVSREGPACAGAGKKCLAIDQVTLQGVVRAPSGSIAVVSSGARQTYFLRENDPVYNGVVVKISPDSIVFRETVMDRLGKTSQREVVKKIHNAPAA